MRSIENHKYTPQKLTSHSHKKKMIDEALAKDILEPFRETVATSLLAGFTPMRKQPQFLLSPSPVKRDLFSQLLGTEARHHTPLDYNDSIIEEDYSYSNEEISQESSMRNSNSNIQEESLSENQGMWSEDNGAKKRKRKSTAQIKLLKQQLDEEMSWTKQKIVKMSEITGLSQSQVYKWFWDQKKKQNKHRQRFQSTYGVRRIIKKDISYRNYLPRFREQSSENIINKQVNKRENIQIQDSHTMLKVPLQIDESGPETQKKVNKRLIF